MQFYLPAQPSSLLFAEAIQKADLQDGSAAKNVYTGNTGVDKLLTTFVIAFAPGTYGFRSGIKLHQSQFLLSYSSVVTFLNVEGYRSRNRWTLLSL